MDEPVNPKTQVTAWGIISLLVMSTAGAAYLMIPRAPDAPAAASSSANIQGSSFETKASRVSKAEPALPAPSPESQSPPPDNVRASRPPDAASSVNGIRSTGEVSRSGYAVMLLSDPIRPGRPDPARPKESPDLGIPPARRVGSGG